MRALFVLAFLLIPARAFADPIASAPLVPVPPGPDQIVPLRRGDPAPVDGQLFDQATALRWANFLQQAQARLKLDVAYQYKLDQVEVRALQDELAVEKKKYEKVTTDLSVKLAAAQQEAQNPPFYKTFWFGASMGAGAVLLTVVVAAFAFGGVN